MVYRNTYQHMYGIHMHLLVVMMLKRWVMMVMSVYFVVISLTTLTNCPCATSVNHRIVGIVLLHNNWIDHHTRDNITSQQHHCD